jgi:hypothetical protein
VQREGTESGKNLALERCPLLIFYTNYTSVAGKLAGSHAFVLYDKLIEQGAKSANYGDPLRDSLA